MIQHNPDAVKGPIYYDLRKILSRGFPVMFVVGERGAGKTYSWKEWAYKDWKKTRAEWAYIRRNPDEIQSAKGNLWDDVLENYGNEHEVKAKGDTCFIRPTAPDFADAAEKKDWEAQNPWEVFGRYFSVSEGQKYKGGSYPKITKACFDEIIIENPRHQYIGGELEPDMYLGLLDTIFRRRGGWKAVAFSNAGAIDNPYFRKWKVTSKDFIDNEYVVAGAKFRNTQSNVLFQYYYEPENAEYNESSIIGQAATESYRSYALANKFKDGGNEFVSPKPKGGEPVLKLTVDGKVWLTAYSSNKPYWWIGSANPQVLGGVYSLDPRKPIEGTIFDETIGKQLKRMYHNRTLQFASPDVREQFLDWIK